jgi:hypothetical protein
VTRCKVKTGRSKNITELVSSDSVVAVKAEDDNIEYYMLKVTSGNSFEYIVCTRQHELKSKSNWGLTNRF